MSISLGSVIFRAAGTRQMKGLAREFDLNEVTSTSQTCGCRKRQPVFWPGTMHLQIHRYSATARAPFLLIAEIAFVHP
jgi:hypothetical protein